MKHVIGQCLVLVLATVAAHVAVAQGFSPEEAAARMTVEDGFQVDLVAAEPLVRQPVAIDFDDRGRLWVIQYLQYPNPAGLKRVTVDRYSRTKYDRVPKPPPHGPVGADRITILEDTDGDGRCDRAKDFVTGLNLTTGFAFGYGGVFVLQVPYLLFYPDRDRDDVPDSDPEVLLTGFGMEDSSSLANSLVWGPDDWLYGTQGTNIMANIRGIEFEQGLWRYHPITKEFELFAEGGSNMWGLDFNRLGHMIPGTNHGGYIIFHGKQGAYYWKKFEKHGELHNPYAFGYFDHVPHEDFQGGHVTVGGIVYQGDAFPERFRNTYIAVDTLGHAVRWHRLHRDGSTFRSENGGVLALANDDWFAPSDAVMGPDGAVYFADWHDQRTAHPDPDAVWDRRNGRVFRLRATDTSAHVHVDPQSRTSLQLLDWLRSSDGWQVARAQRIIGERKEPELVKPLQRQVLEVKDPEHALRTLWALASVGGLDDSLSRSLLDHPEAMVRSWTIRLLGDRRELSQKLTSRFIALAEHDSSPDVISQLASTAGRLPAAQAILLARSLSDRSEFADDPHIPLQIWWAIEPHVVTSTALLIGTFLGAEGWNKPIINDVLLGRIMKRLAAEGDAPCLQACTRILASVPNASERRRMLEALDAGLDLIGYERRPGLPTGSKDSDLAVPGVSRSRAAIRLDSIPAELDTVLSSEWDARSSDPLLTKLAMRLGNPAAYKRAIETAVNAKASEQDRLVMLSLLQELGQPDCVTPLLELVNPAVSETVVSAAMRVLGRFAQPEIGQRILAGYPDFPPGLRALSRDVLLGRRETARALLGEVDAGIYEPSEIDVEQLRRIALHNDEELNALVRKHWGEIRPGTPEEKLAEIRRIRNDLRADRGEPVTGKELFVKNCGICHKMHGEGKEIGPDLTKANRTDLDFLLVSMVDPSAQIRKEFLSYTVLTTDGRIVTGLLIEETPAELTFVNAKNERTSVSRSEIDTMRAMDVSIMPEDALKKLKPQELRDLFAYLQSSVN